MELGLNFLRRIPCKIGFHFLIKEKGFCEQSLKPKGKDKKPNSPIQPIVVERKNFIHAAWLSVMYGIIGFT